MNMIPSNTPVTMSSREIATLVDRRHDQVLRTARELVAQGVTQSVETHYIHEQNGQLYPEHQLNKRDSLVLVARLSPEFTAKVVDRWMELEPGVSEPRLPTTAEGFAHAFAMLADAERREREQNIRLSLIDDRLDKVESAITVMSSRPAAAESIVHVRSRIWQLYGLSTSTVDAVMRQSPYAPKPAGMVRNEHVDADGSTYAVYWKKDVTATFERFVAECRHSAGKLYTHPFIEGRFQLIRRE